MVIRSSTAHDVDRLLKDLQGDDAIRREAALARLRVLGSRTLARLETVLQTGDAATRATVLSALEGIHDPRVVDLAEGALRDESLAVRIGAVATLRPWVTRETGTRVMETLVRCALDEEQPAELRAAAREALADLPPGIITPILAQSPAAASPLAAGTDPTRVAALLAQQPPASLSSLHELVVQLAAGERGATDETTRLQWLVARGAVHAVLARRQSAVALYDLRETFAGAAAPLPLDYLTAVTEIGDADCIEALARAWAATPVSEVWWRERVADAGAAIAARAKLTRRHAAIKRIAAKWPGFLR